MSVQCGSPGGGGVCGVCTVCGVKEDLSKSEQLSAPTVGVVYCLAKYRLALIQSQPSD